MVEKVAAIALGIVTLAAIASAVASPNTAAIINAFGASFSTAISAAKGTG